MNISLFYFNVFPLRVLHLPYSNPLRLSAFTPLKCSLDVMYLLKTYLLKSFGSVISSEFYQNQHLVPLPKKFLTWLRHG